MDPFTLIIWLVIFWEILKRAILPIACVLSLMTGHIVLAAITGVGFVLQVLLSPRL